MDIDEACLKACTTQSLYQLCQDTLRHAEPSGEVTTYAIIAGRVAKLSYEPTMEKVDQLLQSASGDERAAYANCKDKYELAHRIMAAVVNQLFACSFGSARQEYIDASVAVRTCGDALSAFRSSPLYDVNAADQDKTMLAYDLGALIVGK
jgi:NADH:ubiquinone reductase (non-electrogenic)